ncbi:hypothetical protein [Acinetobacter ursingii]|uniref:hypothetical protein n=1 Tax=Acinetobacter ursingii TaxID=108980 RepID=UPI00300A9A24
MTITVATRGAIYPVGLQCKKKRQWPERKLTFNEIEGEVRKADQFHPVLKEFYILTTAESDANVQSKIMALNVERKKQDKFEIVVLFWSEIVRKVALYDQVAKKHFSIGSSEHKFSPLHAIWYTNQGKLELTGLEWQLAVEEVSEDFAEWPSGHIIIRQRETDELLKQRQEIESLSRNVNQRKKLLLLRRELRYALQRERKIEHQIQQLYASESLRFYMMDLETDNNGGQEILKTLIESAVSIESSTQFLEKIRISTPNLNLLSDSLSPKLRALMDKNVLLPLPVNLPSDELIDILNREKNFFLHYENKMTCEVCELPTTVKWKYAFPRMIQTIFRIMEEHSITLEEMELSGYLQLGMWRYSTS